MTLVEIVSGLRIAVWCAFTAVAISIWGLARGVIPKFIPMCAVVVCSLGCVGETIYIYASCSSMAWLVGNAEELSEHSHFVLGRTWTSDASFSLGFSLVTGLSAMFVVRAMAKSHRRLRRRMTVAGIWTSCIGTTLGVLVLVLTHCFPTEQLRDEVSRESVELVRELLTIRLAWRTGSLALLGIVWTQLYMGLRGKE